MERIGEKGRIHGHLLKSAVSLFFCVFGVDCNDTIKNTILSGSPGKENYGSGGEDFKPREAKGQYR